MSNDSSYQHQTGQYGSHFSEFAIYFGFAALFGCTPMMQSGQSTKSNLELFIVSV